MIWPNKALQETAAQGVSGIVLNYVFNAAALQLTLAYPKQSPHYVGRRNGDRLLFLRLRRPPSHSDTPSRRHALRPFLMIDNFPLAE